MRITTFVVLLLSAGFLTRASEPRLNGIQTEPPTSFDWSQLKSDDDPLTLATFHLKGKVSKMEEMLYMGSSMSEGKPPASTMLYEFNDSGFVKKRLVKQGDLAGTTDLYSFEGGSRFVLRKTYRKYPGAGCNDSLVCEYDQQGMPIRMSHYSPWGKWVKTQGRSLTFDKQGRLQTECKTNSSGDTLLWRSLKYEEGGKKLVETIRENDTYKVTRKQTWTWLDAAGRVVKDSSATDDGFRICGKSEYNSQGFQSLYKGSIIDKYGVIQTESTFEYKYDNAGNWVEMTEFYKGKLSRSRKREITYK